MYNCMTAVLLSVSSLRICKIKNVRHSLSFNGTIRRQSIVRMREVLNELTNSLLLVLCQLINCHGEDPCPTSLQWRHFSLTSPECLANRESTKRKLYILCGIFPMQNQPQANVYSSSAVRWRYIVHYIVVKGGIKVTRRSIILYTCIYIIM